MSETPGDEWSRLVKDAREEKKKQPLPGRRSRNGQRKTGFLLPALTVLSLGVLGLHLIGPLNPWPPGPNATQQLAGEMAAVNLAAKALHDYAIFHGHYPEKLADVLPQSMTIEYRLTATGFELRALGSDGKPIVVNSK